MAGQSYDEKRIPMSWLVAAVALLAALLSPVYILMGVNASALTKQADDEWLFRRGVTEIQKSDSYRDGTVDQLLKDRGDQIAKLEEHLQREIVNGLERDDIKITALDVKLQAELATKESELRRNIDDAVKRLEELRVQTIDNLSDIATIRERTKK